MSPTHALALAFRGDTLRYMGKLDLALADYDRSLRSRPEFRPAFVGKGLTYERMGNLERARAEFEKAVASTSQLKSDVNKAGARDRAGAACGVRFRRAAAGHPGSAGEGIVGAFHSDAGDRRARGHTRHCRQAGPPGCAADRQCRLQECRPAQEPAA